MSCEQILEGNDEQADRDTQPNQIDEQPEETDEEIVHHLWLDYADIKIVTLNGPRKSGKAVVHNVSEILPDCIEFNFCDSRLMDNTQFKREVLDIGIGYLMESGTEVYEGDLLEFSDEPYDTSKFIIFNGRPVELIRNGDYFVPHREFIESGFPVDYWKNVMHRDMNTWLPIRDDMKKCITYPIEGEHKNIATAGKYASDLTEHEIVVTIGEYEIDVDNDENIANALLTLCRMNSPGCLPVSFYDDETDKFSLNNFNFDSTTMWDWLCNQLLMLIKAVQGDVSSSDPNFIDHQGIARHTKRFRSKEYSDWFVAQLFPGNVICDESRKRLEVSREAAGKYILRPLVEIVVEYM